MPQVLNECSLGPLRWGTTGTVGLGAETAIMTQCGRHATLHTHAGVLAWALCQPVQADGVSVQRWAISQPRGPVRLDGTYLNPSGHCFSPGGTMFQSRWGNISVRPVEPACHACLSSLLRLLQPRKNRSMILTSVNGDCIDAGRVPDD